MTTNHHDRADTVTQQTPDLPDAVRSRRLGISGPTVARLGLGLMGMSEVYGASDRRRASPPCTPLSTQE